MPMSSYIEAIAGATVTFLSVLVVFICVWRKCLWRKCCGSRDRDASLLTAASGGPGVDLHVVVDPMSEALHTNVAERARADLETCSPQGPGTGDLGLSEAAHSNVP